ARARLGRPRRLRPARLHPGTGDAVSRRAQARAGTLAVVARDRRGHGTSLLGPPPARDTGATGHRRPPGGVARRFGRGPPRERRARGGVPVGRPRLVGGGGEHGGRRGGAAARLPRALRGAAASLSSFLPDPGRGLGMYRLKRFLRAARDTATMPDRYLGLLGKCDDRERAQLYSADLRVLLPGGAAGERLRRLHRDAGAPRGLAAALYLDYKVYLADDILALSDRLSMAHSLELRVPLVDHILAERVFPLPARLKLGGWKLKHLLKRALAGR